MDITLIYPRFALGKIKWEIGGASNRMCPPLDLGWISNLLEKENISSFILDANINRYPDAEISANLKKQKSRIVILTSEVYESYRCMGLRREHLQIYENLIKLIHQSLPDAFIILIGPHATSFPSEVLKANPSLNAVIKGECEATACELAKAVLADDDLGKVKGIAYRRGKEICETEDAPFISDLDSLGIPPYDKLEIDKYIAYHEKEDKQRKTIMVTSRGCSFGCIYCFLPMVGRKFRARSNSSTFEEIDLLYGKYGIRHISFTDETFTMLPKRVEELCSGLNDRKYSLTWDCETRIECLNRDLIKNMAGSGCNQILFGIESLVLDVQKNTKKQIPIEKIKDIVSLCKKEGIYPVPAFQLGLPGDSWDTIRKNLKLMESLGVAIDLPLITRVYPKTELYNLALEKKMINGKSFEELPKVSGLVGTGFKSSEEFKKALGHYHRHVKIINLRKSVNYRYLFKTLRKKGIFYTFRRGLAYLKGIIR